MSSGISGSASAVRLSRKQDGQGGALGDDRFVVPIARAAPWARQEGRPRGTFLIVPNGTERQTTLRKRSVTVGINAQ